MPRKKADPKKVRAGWNKFHGKTDPPPINHTELIDPDDAPEPEDIAVDAAPKKKAKPKDRDVAVAPIPQVEVWERRLVNPVQRGSRKVTLKQKGFEIRIVNTEGTPNRYQNAVHDQGWIPIKISDLADPTEIPGLVTNADDLVRTGPGGAYLWCKMPTAIYNRIARRKVEISQNSRRNVNKHRERLMQQAEAASPGGADAVQRLRGKITEAVERVEMDQDDLESSLPAADAALSRSELS